MSYTSKLLDCVSRFLAITNRVPTPKEVVILGLERGKSRPLEVRVTSSMGRGVFALEPIPEGVYVTEYKYDKVYPQRERGKYAEEYDINSEASYVLDVFIGGKKMCIDATRRLYSYGRYPNECIFVTNEITIHLIRYINHAVEGRAGGANVRPLPPVFVKGKYRVGFISLRAIEVSEELFWDYGQQRGAEPWLQRTRNNHPVSRQ